MVVLDSLSLGEEHGANAEVEVNEVLRLCGRVLVAMATNECGREPFHVSQVCEAVSQCWTASVS